MRNVPRRFAAAAVALAVAVLALAGCGRSDSGAGGPAGKVTVAGSTALLPLVKQAAEEFMEKHSNVTVNVSGGGSFTGLTQLAAGAIDIGTSDVDLTPEFQNKGLVGYKVAVAPFLIIVHPGVAVDNLTQQQLQDIFSGKVTNWQAVGGANQPIAIIHRAPSSGSRATIRAVVLQGQEFTDKATIQDSNGKVREAISQTPGAIGYIDAAYLDQTVKALKYEGAQFSLDNVSAGRYPVYAYEYLFTRGPAEGAAKAYIDYILGAEFQERMVANLGFVPITRMEKK